MADLSSYVDRVRVTLKHASTYKRPSYSVMREMARQNASLIAPQTMVGHSTKNLLVGLDAIKPIKLDPTAQKKLFSTNPADTVKASEYTAKNTSDALQSFSQVPFVDRMVNSDSYPVRNNEDGTHSTHLMESAEVDGVNIAYPRLTYQAGPLREGQSPWVERSSDDALDNALDTGNYVPFSTPAAADSFAKGDWKKSSEIQKRNGKYVLKTKDGKKTLGTHASKEKAMAQETAINISKAKRK